MLLSDVIKAIGSTPLKSFPWGCAVRDVVNLFVGPRHALTMESDGHAVDEALNSLEEEVREMVMRADIDTVTCSVNVGAGDGLVVEHGETEVDPENEDKIINMQRALTNPTFLVVASIVVILLLIAVSLAASLPSNQGIDWNGIFDMLFSLFTTIK